ncbi:sodium:calcium antiporter [Actinoplanes lobatus]|uniref:Cation:H+ antiporter n=1 Tax=Actinoplanes lobatus TaxID=113568 RepID=A0A7W7HGC3_9ACTN|nr:calcium/sodium antiporter [Actinoplanes lobatus]MBB4750039.1 cation:H+ antiporter [Actinoplanes lobatus]GGN74887.1 sodium:calcium antiporter [Actinoplanes lobatus]GIE39074.1 sodium:calcium antiporter [Actinoplanes lobatus]
MLVQILLVLAGLALLTFAADHLVLGSSHLATRLRISPVVVGVVVIGVGTSTPEFLVSALAASRGDTGIAVGNLVGSNILNLTLILGIAALIAPFTVDSTLIRREVPLAVASVAVFAVLAWWGLSPMTALVAALAAAGALYMLVRWARSSGNQELTAEVAEFNAAGRAVMVGPVSRPPAWFEPVRTALGLAGVLAGAQLLVVNAATIATALGVPQLVIGFTLVALGTSLPELVTTIQAQRRGETDLVVGNLFGSNLFNGLAGGAMVGFASGMDHPARAGLPLLVAMAFTALIAWALLHRGLRLSRADGLVLLGAYALTLPLLTA